MRVRHNTQTAKILLLAAATFLGAAAVGHGADTSDANDKQLDYRKLVKGLVSPNKQCECEVDGTHLQFPVGYDAASKRIGKRSTNTAGTRCPLSSRASKIPAIQ
jgi:hypothetical protein